VVTVLSGLIAVPLVIGYLGTERYGAWITISSIAGMLTFADFGIGNGLMTTIAASEGREDKGEARHAISSAFYLFWLLAGVVLMLSTVANHYVSWGRVLNLSMAGASQEVGTATMILLGSCALNLPLGVVQRVQLGRQEGWVANLWQGLASLMGLAALVVASRLRVGLPGLTAAAALPPLAVRGLNHVTFFHFAHRELIPRVRWVDRRVARALIGSGGLYVALQGCTVFAYTADSVIVARLLGASAVAMYSVVYRMFSAAYLSDFLISPLWPAFGEAMARGDVHWVRGMLRRSLLVNFVLTGAVAACLVMAGGTIVKLWTRGHVLPTFLLLLAAAVWQVLNVFQGHAAVVLNHGATLRRQTMIFGAASILAFALKFPMVKLLGVSGVIWATALGFGLAYMRPAWLLIRRRLADLDTARDGCEEGCGAPAYESL
jgi:O-antigen/teichoic acid export membrane protein